MAITLLRRLISLPILYLLLYTLQQQIVVEIFHNCETTCVTLVHIIKCGDHKFTRLVAAFLQSLASFSYRK